MGGSRVIAEIVTPDVVRASGTLFHRVPTGRSEEVEAIECWRDGGRVTVHVMECDRCGGTYEHVNGDYERCPHCGAVFKEVEEDAQGRG